MKMKKIEKRNGKREMKGRNRRELKQYYFSIPFPPLFHQKEKEEEMEFLFFFSFSLLLAGSQGKEKRKTVCQKQENAVNYVRINQEV